MYPIYFQYNSIHNALEIYACREQKEGGMLPPGEGFNGISLAEFRDAAYGKIDTSPSGAVVVKSGRKTGPVLAYSR